MPRTGLILVAAVSLLPAAVWADGLVYRLPVDGDWVQFEMQGTRGPNGTENALNGTVTLSSVGKSVENGDPCRWIEIKLVIKDNGQEQILIHKVLIPEKHLGKGKSPRENVIRGWGKIGDAEPLAVNDFSSPIAGTLPAFLASPLQEVKEQTAVEVETKLGKLSCPGITGRQEFMQENQTTSILYDTRLHDDAPFGVVSSQMAFEVKANGETRDKGMVTVKLADHGKMTLTELPSNR